ncbi:MAG TPA: hypothetical protein VFH80_02315 [Solirubrobacteraceae bacterium]|nr:hypothetical protein [Solirubrobacteraceae bacterium]
MLKLLVVVAGFAIGTAVIAAALALPPPAVTPRARRAAATTETMTAAAAQGPSMGSAPAEVRLAIQHVQKGCHVWSNGTTTAAATMRLHLKQGQKLVLSDMDVDAHQLIELSGPLRIATGAPLTMGHGITLTFTKKGAYLLGTRTVQMPGAAMDVKTIGADNHLRLMLSVT